MPKVRRTIRTLLPTYQKDRQQWRREILVNVRQAAARHGIQYEDDELLEVEVVLYLKSGKRHDIHDVDNRLKDILDALQGRFRGYDSSKAQRLIANDNKVCRAVIEKRPTPKVLTNKRKDTGGKLVIRAYKRKRARSRES
jgi:Holliday junction resolvase RusA-like endonuclease